MVGILDQAPPPNTTKRPHPNLLLHCGARAVKRNEDHLVPTPTATETWTPIPHLELVTQVEHTIRANDLAIGTQAHSLSHEGQALPALVLSGSDRDGNVASATVLMDPEGSGPGHLDHNL